MFRFLKTWRLASALQQSGNASEAFTAVAELGRLGDPESVALLIKALARRDGVSRNAARELGRMGAEAAIEPLTQLLSNPEVNQAAAEALVQSRGKASSALIRALQSESATARRMAAWALGESGDTAAVDALAQTLQTDPDLSVRTAVATALGRLKDPRAIWALVSTLKLRDEVSPDRRTGLEQLREAATLAMRKIGDPLAGQAGVQSASASQSAQAAVEALEKAVDSPDLHPRLLGDLSLLTEPELVSVLRELIAASEEISWANVERRSPLTTAHFASYEQRRRTAEVIGGEFHRRGGPAGIKKILGENLEGQNAIANWWRDAGYLG